MKKLIIVKTGFNRPAALKNLVPDPKQAKILSGAFINQFRTALALRNALHCPQHLRAGLGRTTKPTVDTVLETIQKDDDVSVLIVVVPEDIARQLPDAYLSSIGKRGHVAEFDKTQKAYVIDVESGKAELL